MKICITGGHLSPALATALEIRRRHPDWKIIWVGRSQALAGDKEASAESKIVKDLGIPFFALRAGRLNRMISFETFLWALFIPVGFIQAFIVCIREKPAMIVSFGGYIALPMVVAGFLREIPIVTHEQTRISGVANKIISHFARYVCVSFSEMLDEFKKDQVVYTGLPLRSELLLTRKNPEPYTRIKKPLLYIGGGTTGALSMNRLLFLCLESLLGDFQIVHQTGSQSYDMALSLKNTLNTQKRELYMPVKYLDGESLQKVYNQCVFYLGRSGANTVYELAVFEKPAIFIPLPWSSMGEQALNAEFVSSRGGAIILNQIGLDSEKILESINSFHEHISQYEASMKKISPMFPVDGASRFVDVLDRVVLE